MPTSKETFIKKYLKALKTGDAAVFAGAGLSVASGCVNWKELLEGIAEELNLDINKETDLVSLAQYYVNKTKNRTELNSLIANAFGSDKMPNENHKVLAHIPISTFWTTNYDKLIEKALDSNNKKCDVKSSNSNLATTLKDRDAVLYKMHGDVDIPNESVLIRDDYESYYQTRAPFLNTLSGDLMTKTFLFIGFSFTDPNLSFIFSRLRVSTNRDMRTHYCLMKDILETDFETKEEYEYEKRKITYFIEDLKRFNIQTVLISEYSEITYILKEIKKRYDSKTIYISGAAAEYEPDGKDEYEKFISKLSGRLIDEGYRIVSGFGLGVGSSVIHGALSKIYINQKKTLKDQLILRPFPQGNADDRTLWDPYRRDMISYSGISIFLLGNKVVQGKIIKSDGMRSEYDISKEQGNFLIPVGRTGYISEDFWNELMEEKKEEASFAKYKSDFKILGDKTIPLDSILETIIKLIKSIK